MSSLVSVVTLRAPLTLAECLLVRAWRNAPDVVAMLRTGYKTEQEQTDFYYRTICNAESPHRYYAVMYEGTFIGIGGLTYLNLIPGEAEISLVLGPMFRRQGFGSAAVEALLLEAFGPLKLSSVIGECYPAGAVSFWRQQIDLYPHEVPRSDAAGILHWRWVKPC